MLPSDILGRATTFDLRVMEIANMKSMREQAIREGKTLPTGKHNLSVEQMKAMIDAVKNKK